LETLTILFVLLATSYFLSKIVKKFKLPTVLGPIYVGLIISIFFKEYIPELSGLESFADLGLIFIMFYIGLELNFSLFFKKPGRLLSLSAFNIIIPIVVTYIVMKLIGFNSIVSIIMGLIMTVTATAISIEILKEYGLLESRFGQSIIFSATLDDIFEVIFLPILITYVDKGDLSLTVLIFNILIFFTVIYASRFLIIPYVIRFLDNDEKSQLFIIGTLMVLLVSIISEYLGFGELIGALIAGVIVKFTLLNAEEYQGKKDMTELFEAATFGFLAPFFFIWVGINTDLSHILSNPGLGIILTLLAIFTKVIGSIIGNYIGKGKFSEGLIIGVGMSNKGMVTLVGAEIARAAGLIDQELFSAIIFMIVLTTIISPLLFNKLIKKINIS
jgi:Kef-type K+ transport system membrane component KefB